MRALLLAGGLGTRLLPLTQTVPKCLVEVDGRPLLDYWIELLADAGISDLLVNLHHLADLVRAHIRGCVYPVRITTVFEPALLGTAGTLARNRDFFQGGPAMLIHADNLSYFDVRSFVRRYETRPAGVAMTMMTFVTDTPEACGIVEIDESGIVHAFHEKRRDPPGTLANAAVYILSPEVLDFVAGFDKEVIDFSTEVVPRYLGRINTYQNTIYHRDIGTVPALAAARLEYPEAMRRLRETSAGKRGS